MQSRFLDQRILFTSWHRQRDIQSLNRLLVSAYQNHCVILQRVIGVGTEIAKENPNTPELNVLVVGMPNVGKSTLLNALRNVGIQGRASTSPFLHPTRTDGLQRLRRHCRHLRFRGLRGHYQLASSCPKRLSYTPMIRPASCCLTSGVVRPAQSAARSSHS
jgi:hypothetical protein